MRTLVRYCTGEIPQDFLNSLLKKESLMFSSSTTDEILNISIDGREFSAIKKGERCAVFASSKKLKVLTFKENNMFSNLFSKMQILEDII